MKKEGIIFIVILLFFGIFLLKIISSQGSDSSSKSEWLMFGRTLNHTSWDGSNFTIISGLNNANFTIPNSSGSAPSSLAVAGGYVYISDDHRNFHQLNASNVSQQIAVTTFSMGGTGCSPAVANGYVYVGSSDVNLYQFNATNISQQVSTFQMSDGAPISSSSLAVANGYVYIGSDVNNFYQLNASNISQQISSFTFALGGSVLSPAVANGYVYAANSLAGKGGGDNSIYQLNASNVSQQIAVFVMASVAVDSSPAIANGYVYIGDSAGNVYQLNASNVSQQIAVFVSGGDCTSPAIANGYLYTSCSDSTLYQLNALNISQEISSFVSPIGFGSSSSPSVTKSYVYAPGNIGGNNLIYQLNASNVSQQITNYSIGGYTSSPAIANGYVYIGDSSGNVYQLNATNISLSNLCFESWSCTSFSDCSENIQTRICTDANACGTTTNKPIESQTCDSGGHTAPQVESGGGFSFSQPLQNITPLKPVEITINNSQMDLNSIRINVRKIIPNSSIVITKLPGNDSDLLKGLPIGKLYQIFEIEPGISNSDIFNATLGFRINKTWLTENNITFHSKGSSFWLIQNDIVGNIILYRNPEGANAWLPLVTNFSGEDKQYYHFTAYSQGFSTFAIFFNKYDCLPNSARCDGTNVELCLGNSTWLVTDHCADTCDNGKCNVSFYKSDQFKFLSVVLAVAIITIGIILFIYKKRNKEKRKVRKEIRKHKRKLRKIARRNKRKKK
jgi:PGF-pre-PGF domain-containing protein